MANQETIRSTSKRLKKKILKLIDTRGGLNGAVLIKLLRMAMPISVMQFIAVTDALAGEGELVCTTSPTSAADAKGEEPDRTGAVTLLPRNEVSRLADMRLVSSKWVRHPVEPTNTSGQKEDVANNSLAKTRTFQEMVRVDGRKRNPCCHSSWVSVFNSPSDIRAFWDGSRIYVCAVISCRCERCGVIYSPYPVRLIHEVDQEIANAINMHEEALKAAIPSQPKGHILHFEIVNPIVTGTSDLNVHVSFTIKPTCACGDLKPDSVYVSLQVPPSILDWRTYNGPIIKSTANARSEWMRTSRHQSWVLTEVHPWERVVDVELAPEPRLTKYDRICQDGAYEREHDESLEDQAASDDELLAAQDERERRQARFHWTAADTEAKEALLAEYIEFERGRELECLHEHAHIQPWQVEEDRQRARELCTDDADDEQFGGTR